MSQISNEHEKSQQCGKCNQVGHTIRSKNCPLYSSSSSSSSQNQSSNERVLDGYVSEEGENDDDVDNNGEQPPDMEPDSDSDDELDEAENDDIDDYEWEDYNIVTFVPEVPNISIRNSRSSSSNDDEPSTDDWLPKFNGCRSRGNFEGVNKSKINQGNCSKPLDFSCCL